MGVLTEEVAVDGDGGGRAGAGAVDLVAVVGLVEGDTGIEGDPEVAGLGGGSAVFEGYTEELWSCSCCLFMRALIIRYQISIPEPGTLSILHRLVMLTALSISSFQGTRLPQNQ